MMGRTSNIDKTKFVSYDKNSNTSKCLSCDRILKGNLLGNMKRHYMQVHKYNFESENERSSSNERNVSSRRSGNSIFLKLNKSEFLKCCVGLVAVKNIPFRIFDDDIYFKQIIEPYERLFDLNLNSKNMADRLKTCSNKIKEVLARTLKKKLICLKVDVATRMDKSILGVNIQYIKDFKIFVNTVGMIQLRKRHTASFLKEEIVKCLGEFNIDVSQIYSSTTDNGANVLKASKLLQQEMQELPNNDDNDRASSIYESDNGEYEEIHMRLRSVLAVVRCAAHTIQLAAHDALKDIQAKIEECRAAVKILRVNIRSGRNALDIRMPTIDNLTRWNSTYEMVESLYKLKDYTENNEIEFPVEIDWDFIQKFLEAFQPMAECTKRLQAEQYIIGDFYRDWLVCEAKLEKMSENVYAKKLLESMLKRKDRLLNNEAFIAAIYFDPRFNYLDSPFLNEDQKKNALTHILKTSALLNLLDGGSQDNGSLQSSSQVPVPPDDPFDVLEEKLNTMTASTSRTSTTQRSLNIRQKLDHFTYGQRMNFGTNVLEYWKNISLKEKDLAKLAEVILAVPSSQTSVERSFSALSTLLTKQRSRLSSETINSLLIVKLNYNLLQLITLDDAELI